MAFAENNWQVSTARHCICSVICLKTDCVQTTSPSYLLLASLDACQAFAHDWKRKRVKLLSMDSVFRARAALKQLPGIVLLEDNCGKSKHTIWLLASER